MQEVLHTQLDLNIDVFGVTRDIETNSYDFEGSIIELFAQLVNYVRLDPFTLLLEQGIGFFNPSIALLSFVGSHDHDRKFDFEHGCHLSRLLQLGATPNISGYMVTPLQIAVASWDFEGVMILLEAGADPNGTGDSGGI